MQREPDGEASEGYPKVGEPAAANKQRRHGWEEGLLKSLYG
ncbi:MAG: hypothetical protein ACO2PN_17805 [Pyrobaculum sp.]